MISRKLFLTICFLFFIWPISVDGISANYSFVLLPLTCLGFQKKLIKPTASVAISLAIFFAIFLIALLYQFEFFEEWPRRFLSFAIFISIFSYAFVKIDSVMIDAFKASVVIVSVLFSLYSGYLFYSSGGSSLGFDAKDVVGGQRFGFIYLLAFWILFILPPKGFEGRYIKYSLLVVVIGGLLLTFSRSSVVALVASFCFFVVGVALKELLHSPINLLYKSIILVLGLLLLATLMNMLMPVAFDFLNERLFENNHIVSNLEIAETSEGTRIFIWGEILEFVTNNPVTGSGFLGVWILRLFDEYSGSAHNQFMDVLFRTGVVGFSVYLYLICRIFRCLRVVDKGLFFGFVAMLVYGVFHETFKESQGAFVLTFLIGMMSSQSLLNKATPRVASNS